MQISSISPLQPTPLLARPIGARFAANQLVNQVVYGHDGGGQHRIPAYWYNGNMRPMRDVYWAATILPHTQVYADVKLVHSGSLALVIRDIARRMNGVG